MKKILLSIAIVVFFLLATKSTDAALASYVRIFYYREGTVARTSLYAHYKSIDVLAPQTYSLNENGTLEGSIDPAVLLFTRSHAIALMPVVTNKSFGQASLQGLLNDQVKQDAAIASLIAEAKLKNYWGWQIDFEQMDISYKDSFSAFIRKMYAAMKANNVALSVATVAQISSNPADYPNNLWNKLIGVYDLVALAPNSDFISIMSFDDPISKGPVARYSWVDQVINFSLKAIPPEKISLGIPLYYWKWDEDTGKRVGIGGYEGIKNVLKIKHTIGYDTDLQAPFMRYTVAGSHYTLWYENGQSMKKTIELITNYGLQGFSAWALGLEAPSVYDAIKK